MTVWPCWCVRAWVKTLLTAASTFSVIGGGSEQHSAYRLGTVVIEYKWHPLHGRRLPLMRRIGCGGNAIVHVEIRVGIWRELPAWMTEASTCAAMSLGPPQLSVVALNELRAVLSDGSTQPSVGESRRILVASNRIPLAGSLGPTTR